MSMMRCEKCERLVDTDVDVDSLYYDNAGYECLCQHCAADSELTCSLDTTPTNMKE